MATATEPDLHLIELRAENFKRLSAFLLRADGHHAVIRARNGKGKTTACQALESLLRGANSKSVPEPIKAGESKAVISADLGEIVVTRTITEKGNKLEVRAADGSKVARPQELLDLLRGTSFDVIGFMDARPQDQVDAVLSVCQVTPPVDAVREATGEEHPAKAGESADAYLGRLSADDTGLFFVKRRDAGRIVDQKRKALAEQEKVVQAFGDHGDADVSTADLLDRIERLSQEEELRRVALADADKAHNELDRAERLLALRESELQAATRRVLDLEKQLDEARAAANETAERIARGKAIVADLRTESQAADEVAQSHPDRTQEIAGLRQQVRTAEANASQRHKREAAVDQERRLTLDVNDAGVEHERLDKVLNRLRYLRAHLLDDVDLGIAGLEVGQGELRLNGLSLRSASTAEQLTVAVAVATRQESRLKVLWIDGGERLDTEHRELLIKLADQAGWQVVLTVVSDDEEPVIEIVEGEAA